MKTTPVHWTVIACLSLLAIGCAKTPAPDFYLLAPDVPSQTPGFEEGVAVGVGPVELPPHLDRNQIVSRAASCMAGCVAVSGRSLSVVSGTGSTRRLYSTPNVAQLIPRPAIAGRA